jgi:hypothetical protein
MTDDLHRRLQRLEDEREIARLIASYGPSVDCANADSAANLWAEDGTYDVEGWRMNSRDDVRAMVSSQSQRHLVANGCCHFLGPCVITVTGDTAVVLCESLVLVRRGDEYVVRRATANHFELKRIDARWKIVTRASRLLNGNPEAHGLLRAGLSGVAATLDP